jgi:hypothetical protein
LVGDPASGRCGQECLQSNNEVKHAVGSSPLGVLTEETHHQRDKGAESVRPARGSGRSLLMQYRTERKRSAGGGVRSCG